jgi:CRISPR/Cas system type I-B associated protein Csh2 (Cas7 group RAMP superfamily)
MATYDSTKRYSWNPEDKFVLTGSQFGIVLNALRAVLNTEEAARILLINEANNAIERALHEAVENDVVKEAPEAPSMSLVK